MNIKRYLAKDNAEAMAMVKEELGSDAVIIHSRRVRQKGILGFFKKPMTELIVAIDYDEKAADDGSQQGDAFAQTLAAAQKSLAQKEIVQESKLAQEPKFAQESKPTDDPKPVMQHEDDGFDELVYNYYQRLIDVNTRTEIVDFIFEQVLSSLGNNRSKQDFVRSLKSFLREKLGRPYKLEELPKSKKNLIFIGPTGVGKTTTIAKVAAKLSIFQNKNVGLITADTFRIAAVEQLKTYAQILGLDVSVVYEAEELKEKLLDYKDKDYVILDSAGRNHKSDEMKNDVIELLRYFEEYECFLVLSLGSSKNDIRRIIDSYEFIKDYHLVFTKLDETENYGNILNARFQCAKSIAFITNGQNVPDDIVTMDVDGIVDLILGEAND